MANIITTDLQTRENEAVVVAGSFAPAGTGAPTASKGKGFTVARTGVGAFRITLDARFNSILSVVAGLQLATATDQFIVVGAISEANRTIDLTVWDPSAAAAPGAAVDVAADAGNRIHFVVVARNSSI